MDSLKNYDWWVKHIPKIADDELLLEPKNGFWVGPNQYRFRHPVTRRTQDMVFENIDRHDPEYINRLIGDQERKALVELANPVPDRKASRHNIARRVTMIQGREEAVLGRWY